MIEDILKLLLGTILGAAIGAVVTIRRTRYSVFSADFSNRVANACTLIDEMADCASRAWAGVSSGDPLKSNRHYIVGLKARLSVLIHSLEADYRGMKTTRVQDAFVAFSGASTGGKFSSLDSLDEQQINVIQKYAEELKCELYGARIQKY